MSADPKRYTCYRAAEPLKIDGRGRDSVGEHGRARRHRLSAKGRGQLAGQFSRVEWEFDYHKGGYLRREGPPCDNWVWSPQGAINMHIPEMWGFVDFSDTIAGRQSR